MVHDKNEAKRIVIFGIGKGADAARRYFEWDTPHQIAGYVVDREFLTTPAFRDHPVIAVDEAVKVFPPDDVFAFVPLGATRMNTLRAEKYALLKSLGYRFVSYVHSSNKLLGHCEIGENCFIL